MWGAWVELAGWICPLTPLEVDLRIRAGEVGYGGGFIERYVTAALYPQGLTREIQIATGYRRSRCECDYLRHCYQKGAKRAS